MKCQNLPSISFHTLGCKLNQAESEELCLQFTRRGWNVVDGDSADVHVVNTCTVTHIADRKARGLLRSLRRANPQALIVATGCYVQRSADDLLKAGAGMLIDNEDKARLPAILADVLECGSSCCRAAAEVLLQTRARSFVKIQDGCRQFCSYCIVPLVRPGELSLPAGEIINSINDRVAQGYKEVVLTGTRIGSYRDGDTGLAALLRRILLETEIQRLHLSSLQPAEISAPLLELWSDSRLVQHFHLALQSGSASVLERMGRKYSPREYGLAVQIIRRHVPHSAVTTDIMVGFPGESDTEFEQSYEFCRQMQFAALHVFMYSARPGTRAAEMPAQVADKVKKERSLRMLSLARDSAAIFRQRFIGGRAGVLFEHEERSGSGLYSGLTQNYIRVYCRGQGPLCNQIRAVSLVKGYRHGLWGEILP